MQRSDGKAVRPLTAAHVSLVVKKIDDWPVSRRLTWTDIINLAALGSGRNRYEWGRVALARNADIAAAYKRKAKLSKSVAAGGTIRRSKSPDVDMLEQKIAGLQAELKKRDSIIAVYDAKFVRWLYNVALHGVSVEALDAPVEPPDRNQSAKDEIAAARQKKGRK